MMHAPDRSRPRVLVASDLGALRAIFRDFLPAQDYDLFFEDGTGDVPDFAQWAQPHIIFLALEDAHASVNLCQRLRSLPALAASAIAVLSLPSMDPALFMRCRQPCDRVLLVQPTRHEIATFAARHAQRLRGHTGLSP